LLRLQWAEEAFGLSCEVGHVPHSGASCTGPWIEEREDPGVCRRRGAGIAALGGAPIPAQGGAGTPCKSGGKGAGVRAPQLPHTGGA
jgi:hypothetical protein